MSATESVLRPREVLTGGNVKGGVVRAHLQWVRDYHGDAAVSRALSMLPVEAGMEVSSALASTWVSFESVVLLDRTIEKLFGRGNRLFLRELGRYSARFNLSTRHRLFRREDLHKFFRCSAVLHTHFQDFGAASYRQTSPTGGEMIHTGYDCYSAVYCQSALGYYEQVIAIHGATPFLVMERTCQCAGNQDCTFEMAWD